jgi:hypothetical protein
MEITDQMRMQIFRIFHLTIFHREHALVLAASLLLAQVLTQAAVGPVAAAVSYISKLTQSF